MKFLSLLFPLFLFFPEKAYKVEFGKSANRTSNWVILSDNVMGGVSEHKLSMEAPPLYLRVAFP